MPYEYKMVQIPDTIEVRGAETGTEAAQYLATLTNEQARQGWEFQRVDTIGVRRSPGCLGALLRQEETVTSYYVVTFRKET